MSTSPGVQNVELGGLQAAEGTVSLAPSERMAALADVRAQVSVMAGTATSTVGEILNLKEGTVLTLDTALNSPFDVVLNGTVIARGELVAVGDQLGLRVTQVQVGAR